MRRTFGWTVFALLAIPYIVTMIIGELCIRFGAVCEATVCSIMDNENWLHAYNREMEYN